MKITVEHPNGYKGVLFGQRSMSIYDPDGNEIFHTGHRTINTEWGLYQALENASQLLELFDDVFEKDEVDL